MPPLFLDLPPELVIRILYDLDLNELLACQLVHSSLRAVIKNSVLLEYHSAAQIAGIEDNPDCKLSISERLSSLSTLEDGWSNFEVDFFRELSVKHDTSGIYDLTGGIYLLGDLRRRALYYCALPSTPSDPTEWTRIDVGATVIDMGLAVYEHDLIAVVTTTPKNADFTMHSIAISLLKLSTGEPHPLAHTPKLSVTDSWWSRPAIAIEIVGDNLALTTTHLHNQFRPNDKFYVFDWKAGIRKIDLEAAYNSYTGVVFLSPDLILLPNMVKKTLEFWEVPTSPSDAPSDPIGSLGLPALKDGYTITGFACRCEPNPVKYGTPFSSRPFQCSPLDAIAIFNVRIQRPDVLGTSFSMFVHRRSLLDLYPKLKSLHDQPRDTSDVNVIPWEEWGPTVTRWLKADFLASRWITTTAGQRCVILVAVANTTALINMDFNPNRIKRWNAEVGRSSRQAERAPHSWAELGPTDIADPCFEQHITSQLPYISQMAGMESYAGILMDEERLIGLQTDELDRVTDIDILHMGTDPDWGGGTTTDEMSMIDETEQQDDTEDEEEDE